jgi:hypothetical protein
MALNDSVRAPQTLRFINHHPLAGSVSQNFCGQPARVPLFVWYQGLNPP